VLTGDGSYARVNLVAYDLMLKPFEACNIGGNWLTPDHPVRQGGQWVRLATILQSQPNRLLGLTARRVEA